MGSIFIKLLNMSITASWLILAILCVRLIFREIPKWINCLLWGLVAIRLICPFSIESALSLQPSAEPIRTSTMLEEEVVPYLPSIDSDLGIVENTVNPMLAETFAYEESESVAPLQVFAGVMGNIWFVGMILLLVFAFISMIRLYVLVRESVPYKERIYICDTIKSPFILGVIKPRIYLSSALSVNETEYIIAHEKAHLQRKDYLWKPLGYLLVCVYWFNPLCWIAYNMLCKDIELACDEKVIKDMDFDNKKEYSRVLLSCASQKHLVYVCPLAFGEVGVKERVKSVLAYKKPALWISIIAVLLCIIIAICFLTNPESKEEIGESLPTENEEGLSEWITEEINTEKRDVTHDGVADYIVTSMTYDSAYMDEDAALADRVAQQIMYDVICVKVYEGLDTSDTYSEEQLLWSQEYSRVHVGNGQLSIVQKDGKDYLLTSSLWGGQGAAAWDYEVFSLNELGEKEAIGGRSIEFEIGEESTASSCTEFKQSLEEYISDGILIVACDIDFEKQLIRMQENPYIPRDYYSYAFSKFDMEEETGSELNIDGSGVFDELSRVVGSVGLENAYPWNNTVNLKSNADALIKMASDETGRFEIYGIMSAKYGTYGLLLNDWIDGEQNWNFAYVPWCYTGGSSSQPILEPDGNGKYIFTYIYQYADGVPLWREYVLDCGYETAHMELISKEEYDKMQGGDADDLASGACDGICFRGRDIFGAYDGQRY